MKILTLSSNDLASTPLESSNALIFMPFINPMQAKKTADMLANRSNADGTIVCVYDADREGFISIANRLFKNSHSPYIGYLAEDAFPGRDWLLIGLNKLKTSSLSLLAFNDGKWAGNLASFGLVERDWAKKNYQGNLFYPSYKKHYADTELTLIAKSEKVFAYDPHSIVMEIDWEENKKIVDEKDRKLFLERALKGFEGRVSNPVLLKMFS
jgi:hypothetical protein